MKKIFRILAILFILTGILAVSVACSTAQNNKNKTDEQEERKIISVTVNKGTIPQNAYAGEVKVSQITLKVVYDELDENENNVVEEVALTEEYLGAGCAAKLKLKGTQKIDVVYQNWKCSFTIYLLDPNDVNVNLTVEGGRPITVDGEAITTEEGEEVYRGSFAKGAIVVIDWNEIEGKVFSHWTCDGNVVDNQRKTSVTMNSDKTYKAFSDDITYSVTFVTLNPSINIPQRKAKSIASSGDIKAEMTMEDYVFVGWTTEEMTKPGQTPEQFVEFPYAITEDVTFYAVWTPTGFLYNTVSIQYAGNKLEGKAIVAYEGSLTELNIPSETDGQAVIAITKDAFKGENAKKLTSITIPSSIRSIDDGAFANCSSLQSFTVDAASQDFSHERGVLYMNQRSTLVAYPQGRVAATYSLEAQVTKISDYAFYNAVLGSISVQDAVKNIGSHAFDSAQIDHVDFTKLKASDLTTVGDDVFNANISSIYVSAGEDELYKKKFASSADKVVTDGNKVNNIYADENDNGEVMLFRLINGQYFDVKERTAEIVGFTRTAKSVVIPDRAETDTVDYLITSIGKYAFKDCIYLEDVTLPTGLERICDYAFDDTVWIKKAENEAIIANETLYKYIGKKNADGKYENTYILDESVKRIAEGAFQGNKVITQVNISKNTKLERIDAFAFDGCVNLNGFTSDEKGSSVLIKNSLKTIDEYAFRGTAIKEIQTQETSQNETGTLVSLGDFAFADCVYLEKAYITSGALTEIGTRTFGGCYALEEINVSDQGKDYASFDGILYKIVDSAYSLFRYPSAKMLGVFNPSKPGKTELNVTELGEYCLEYANIGALEIEEGVSFTNFNAVLSPSLTYVKFCTKTTLNNASYANILASSDPEKVVFSEELDSGIIDAFFGRDSALKQDKATTTVPYEFEIKDSLLLAKSTDDNSSVIKIVGSDRQAEELTASEAKAIGSYAFFGYNLKTLVVNNVSEFEEYALWGAYGLRTLEIKSPADGASVPKIDKTSFGEDFADRLTIKVYTDPEASEGYFDKWEGIIETFTYKDVNGNEKTAAKNVIYDKPFAVLTYLDQDEKTNTAVICNGVITKEDLDKPNGKRGGYSVGGWIIVTEDNKTIDLSDIAESGYAIDRNMVLRCEWVADEYTIYFEITDDITLNFGEKKPEQIGDNRYKYVLNFGEKYDFSVIDANKNVYNFEKWQSEDETTKVDLKGEWGTVLYNREITLIPLRTKKEYKIVYDKSVEVKKNEQTVLDKTVYYGEKYILDVPESEGYAFKGWQIKNEEGNYVSLTDENGVGLIEWRIAATEAVTVYPMWQAKEITVNLYLTAKTEPETDKHFYKKVTVTYGSDSYSLGSVSLSEIFEGYRNDYGAKVEYFAGWADQKGNIYTDYKGEAIKEWDKPQETEMYAVWPRNVSTYDELKKAIDDNASLLLENDIEISAETRFDKFSGVFNGNGKTVTITAKSPTSGLINENNGTIKNVHFVINVDFETSQIEGTSYFGGICALNNGYIEGVTAEITSNVTIGSEEKLFFGGLVGYNNGTLNVTQYTVNKFVASIDATDNGAIYLGSVVGVNVGSVTVSANIKGFSVTYGEERFIGQTDTIGSVAGANEYALDGGETLIGEFLGTCQLTGNAQSESYKAYENATDEAKNANAAGEWETKYTNYYYYSNNKICNATEDYSSNRIYYCLQEQSKDFFYNENRMFGANRVGNSSGLRFTSVQAE